MFITVPAILYIYMSANLFSDTQKLALPVAFGYDELPYFSRKYPVRFQKYGLMIRALRKHDYELYTHTQRSYY